MSKKIVFLVLSLLAAMLLSTGCSQELDVASSDTAIDAGNVSRAVNTTPVFAQEVTSGPKRDTRWVTSTSLYLDRQILGVKIVAYRIKWFSGAWSAWYVPGVNDLYQKPGETVRRAWACFNDHTHQYLSIPSNYAYSLRDYSAFDRGYTPSAILSSGIHAVSKGPANNPAWVWSLDINIDRYLDGEMIVAYKVTWFNGQKSGWFVPGYQDIYQKPGETLRRWWACFNDHSHEYISFPIN